MYRTIMEFVELSEEEDGEINSEKEAIEVAKQLNDMDWTRTSVEYEADLD